MPRQKIVWLITGDRQWTDQVLFEKTLDQLEIKSGPSGDVILHGNAAGADSCASWYAMKHGIMEVRVPYPQGFGRMGGPLRNQQMAEICQGLTSLGYACRVVAFHDDLDGPTPNGSKKRGTKDMVERMHRKGFRITLAKHRV